MQSRLMSLVESVANIAVGIIVAFVSNAVVMPLVGMQMSVGQNVALTTIFTAISLVRSYTLRRVFNALR